VAFVGVFRRGTGIFTQKALLVQAGDVIGGQKLTSFGSPAINDAGTVAFFATHSGGAGIFTQTSLIAKTGDAICGKTLAGLGPPAINNNGEVAFVGLFSDGSSAVILARPTGRSLISTTRIGQRTQSADEHLRVARINSSVGLRYPIDAYDSWLVRQGDKCAHLGAPAGLRVDGQFTMHHDCPLLHADDSEPVASASLRIEPSAVIVDAHLNTFRDPAEQHANAARMSVFRDIMESLSGDTVQTGLHFHR
jgi:hypothetical protein